MVPTVRTTTRVPPYHVLMVARVNTPLRANTRVAVPMSSRVHHARKKSHVTIQDSEARCVTTTAYVTTTLMVLPIVSVNMDTLGLVVGVLTLVLPTQLATMGVTALTCLMECSRVNVIRAFSETGARISTPAAILNV